MKLDLASIKQVLIKFAVCDSTEPDKSITNLHKTHPRADTTSFSFKFRQTPMWLIFDEQANDDFDILAQQTTCPSNELELLANPAAPGQFALPILSKTAYLLRRTSSKLRLDQRLRQLYPDRSRSKLQQLVKQGLVSVKQQVIQSPSFLVSPTDQIELKNKHGKKQACDFPILYEDADILVLDKPAGVLSVARLDQDLEWTLEDFARTRSQIKSGPVLAHRLDRLTSGVILAAKNPVALEKLRQQFKDRHIQKIYYALIEGEPQHKAALIDLPLARSIKQAQKFQVSSNGRSAQTKYQLLSKSAKHSLVKLEPKTGRTHQLRVHMAYLGTPIVGDPLYGSGAKSDRLMLHAQSLSFTNTQGQKITVTSQLPEEFRV